MPSLRALSVKEIAHPCHVTMAVSEAPIASEEHHDHCDARVYDTVCLDEMEYVEDDQMYYYQCPCGDLFELSTDDLAKGITIAKCPSCSLRIRVTLPSSAAV